MTTPTLLPCPWCGNVDVELLNVPPRPQVWCYSCSAKGPQDNDAEAAIARWNARAPGQREASGVADRQKATATAADWNGARQPGGLAEAAAALLAKLDSFTVNRRHIHPWQDETEAVRSALAAEPAREEARDTCWTCGGVQPNADCACGGTGSHRAEVDYMRQTLLGVTPQAKAREEAGRLCVEALEAFAALRGGFRAWQLAGRIPGWQKDDDVFAKAETALAAAKAAGLQGGDR
jgi:restriction alleviation protein Lar